MGIDSFLQIAHKQDPEKYPETSGGWGDQWFEELAGQDLAEGQEASEVIGLDITKIKENETLGQFRQRVCDKLLEATGVQLTPNQLYFCKDSWYDG